MGIACFRVEGFWFRVSGFGFRVSGLGFGVWGLGFGVWGLGFGVWGLGFGRRLGRRVGHADALVAVAVDDGGVPWFRGGLVFEAHRLLHHSP